MKRLLLTSCAAAALLVATPQRAEAEPISLAVAALSTASLGSSAFAFSAFGFTLKGFSAVAANFAVRAALGYALNALASKPGAMSRGYNTNVNQLGAALPHQIIYGETRVGGAVTYQTVTSSGGGRTDRLHRVIAFAGHEIDSFQSIFLDDQEVTLDTNGNVTAPAEFAGHVRIKQHLGTDDQAADADLVAEVSEWTADHRMQGIAYLYARFEDAVEFPNGVPNVSAVIRGRKVEDSRYTLSSGVPDFTYAQDDTILNASYTRTSDLFFEIDLSIPQEPDGIVMEIGGGTSGVYLGFHESNLIFRAGSDDSTPDNAAILTIDPSRILNMDVTLYGAVNVPANSVTLWYRQQGKTGLVLLGSATAAGTLDGVGRWAGTGDGAVGRLEVGTPGPNTADYNSTITGARFFDATPAPVADPVTAWSDNPVMCIRDYLLADFGLRESAANIDEHLFAAAADTCDIAVSGDAQYTCNGSFLLDASPESILRSLLSSLGGIFWNYAGRWAIQAAEYIEPTLSLTQDDMRGDLSIATRHSRRDNFNTVVGQYKGPATEYQPDNYAAVSGVFYLSEDNGIETTSELNLLFTDTEVMAQRIARTYLRRNRKQLTVTGAFGLSALGLRIGNNVMLTVEHLGWTQKVFEVVDWRLGIKDKDIQVVLLLREMTEEVFTGVNVTLEDQSGNILLDQSGTQLEAIVN